MSRAAAGIACSVCATETPPLFPDARVQLPTVLNNASSSSSSSSNSSSSPISSLYACRELQNMLSNLHAAANYLSSEDCRSVQLAAQEPCGCAPCTTIYKDRCPLQMDGRCGSYDPYVDPFQLCLQSESDCIDCDPYYQHLKTCTECLENGGYWCPTDAACSSWPLPGWLPGFIKYGSCHDDEASWLHAPSSLAFSANYSSFAETKTIERICSFPHESSLLQPPDFVVDIPQDPLVPANSWAYELIRVREVWKQGITGRGVRIRFNDDGVDADHEEFHGRFDWIGSCDKSQPVVVGNDSDASSSSSSRNGNNRGGTHGTSCASIAAGAANNGMCAVGIAPSALISSCTIFHPNGNDSNVTDDDSGPEIVNYPESLTRHLDRQDISSNSYGYYGCQSSKTASSSSRRRRRRRKRRRREMQDSSEESGSNCPFLPDSFVCRVCNFSSFSQDGPLSDSCAGAISHYCSNSIRYEADPDACLEYLETFASCGFNALSGPEQAQLSRGIRMGRGGLGLIFVFPAGNEGNFGNYASYTGYGNSRMVITVGAVNRWGDPASYTSPGSGVLVSAPGGDYDSRTNWMTALAGGRRGSQACHDATYGTSFATPVVAGVLALVLEVNPTLSWRDVQGLLAATSRVFHPYGRSVDDNPENRSTSTRDDEWTRNRAGLWHSYRYGFGVVDAEAAVNRARQWRNYGKERFVAVESERNESATILDGGAGTASSSSSSAVVSTLTVHVNFTVESVVVYLNLVNTSRGHLRITLMSPSGTESILTPGQRPENHQSVRNERWKLMTVRSWGEGSVGNWTLTIVDAKAGGVSNCIDQVPESGYNDLLFTCPRADDNPDDALTMLCQREAAIAAACCMCGGGQNVSAVTNVSHSWMLMVYGHDPGESGPNPASSASPVISIDFIVPSCLSVLALILRR